MWTYFLIFKGSRRYCPRSPISLVINRVKLISYRFANRPRLLPFEWPRPSLVPQLQQLRPLRDQLVRIWHEKDRWTKYSKTRLCLSPGRLRNRTCLVTSNTERVFGYLVVLEDRFSSLLKLERIWARLMILISWRDMVSCEERSFDSSVPTGCSPLSTRLCRPTPGHRTNHSGKQNIFV